MAGTVKKRRVRLMRPSASVSVSPATIDNGNSSTITWTTTNATTVTLNGSPVAGNGTTTVSPSTTTDYTLLANGPGGSASDVETLVVVTSGDPEQPTPSGFLDAAHDEKIPDFGGAPTTTSIKAGAWESSGTWDNGVPALNDVVSIKHAVTYATNDTSTSIACVCIESGGSLTFDHTTNTALKTVVILVKSGGTLTVGTTTNPIASNKTAQIIISDVPLNTDDDPQQYSNAFMVFGKCTMHGSVLNETFVRLANEVSAGATTLVVNGDITGWKAGDVVVIPDTRQLGDTEYIHLYQWRSEVRTISSISSDTITLTSAATYAHKGARDKDSTLVKLPHIMNLSRNLVVKSENPSGTRGHFFATLRAEVDQRYVAFQSMGRSLNDSNNDTTFDGAGGQPHPKGNVTHIGTNQTQRYPYHAHHNYGPVTPPSNGYQLTLSGCSVYETTLDQAAHNYRWGITLHRISYALVEKCVVYNYGGWGIGAEDGSTCYNTFDGNMTCGIYGSTNPRNQQGFEGTGFWFRCPTNYVTNNVAAHTWGRFFGIVSGQGFNFVTAAAETANTKFPLYQGADIDHGTVNVEYELVNVGAKAVEQFSNNEAYGATAVGMTLWTIGTSGYSDRTSTPVSTIEDFLAWHCWEEAVFLYPTFNVVFDGITFYGDAGKITAFQPPFGITGGDYRQSELTIRNGTFHNVLAGIYENTDTPGNILIENCFFHARWYGIGQFIQATPGASAALSARTTTIRNCTYQSVTGYSGSFKTISMVYHTNRSYTNYIVQDDVYVEDHAGTPGDNFRLYYTQQIGSFITPQSGPIGIVGSPSAGKTNTQNLADHGVCIAGSICPSTTTRSDINGYIV